MDQDNDTGGDVPCFAHLLVNGTPVDPQTQKDVAQFRRAERARLLDLRRALSPDALITQSRSISRSLDRMLTLHAGITVGVYWPIRGELDLRDWMKKIHLVGAQVALPVVVTRDAPVEFHLWSPGCRMKRGIWNIPVPTEAVSAVPNVVISPLLGVDKMGFRLGNGGGYYDRTLADMQPMPRVIGVGHDFCRIRTIFPMPWDIGMQQVVLGDGTITQHSQA